MVDQIIKRLFRSNRDHTGASLIELSVSLLVISTIAVGFTGAVTVGVLVASRVEDQDTGLIIARSQAEFIASQPAAPSYVPYPSVSEDVIVTSDVVEGCLGRAYLQCLSIQVTGEEIKTADAVLEAFKAQRFLEVGVGGPEPARVPESSGLLRVYTFSLDPIPFQKAIPIILPKVIQSISPTNILVHWRLNQL